MWSNCACGIACGMKQVLRSCGKVPGMAGQVMQKLAVSDTSFPRPPLDEMHGKNTQGDQRRDLGSTCMWFVDPCEDPSQAHSSSGGQCAPSAGRARRMSLHDAAAAGDLKTVTSALLDPTADVNAPEGKAQNTPLHIAARHGQLEAARILLEVPPGLRRVNVNEKNAVSPRPRPRCTQSIAYASDLNRVCRW